MLRGGRAESRGLSHAWAGSGRRGPCSARRRRKRVPGANPGNRDRAAALESPSGEPLLKGRIPEPPGRTHKPALAPGRAPFACGPDAAAAARCGASRRQRARRGRQGSRVPPWPPSPGPQHRGGSSRGLLDVRAAAAGNPRAVPSASWGRAGRSRPAAPSKALASVPRGSSFPDASGRVRGGASGSRSLTSPRLDQSGMLRMLFAAASPREREGETLPPRGQAQAF